MATEAGSPQSRLHKLLREVMEEKKLWSASLEAELPRHWEKHGDCILLPPLCLASDDWKKAGDRIWELICSNLQAKRVARRTGPTQNDGYRRPRVELVFGDDPWITKKENGINYSWDITKCMFSSGNISEKQRIASWDCRGQVIVDLYAGIGYFTLTYLVHAKANLVYAIEWNPDALAALAYNLRQNGVEERCVVIAGNNEEVCPRDVADHVNLGLIPSSEASWPASCVAISKTRGGVIHVHGNVDSKNTAVGPGTNAWPSSMNHFPLPWLQWAESVAAKFVQHFKAAYEDMEWAVELANMHRIKSYGPHVDHLVVDIRCTPCDPMYSLSASGAMVDTVQLSFVSM